MNIKVHYVNHVGWGKDENKTFDLGDQPYPDNHLSVLDKMWEQFNNVIENPKAGQLGYYSQKFGVRSMSVGDLIELDGETYVCCGMGWQKISNVDAYRKWFAEETRFTVYEEDVKEFV